MSSKKCCGTCYHYDYERDAIGMCRHPVVELMRALTRDEQVPFAFSELEVTTLRPMAGEECNTWRDKQP